ncbi:MAG: hypothetical protein WAM14_19595 [Candidatus Nitrosopolaris sp.]
MSEMVDKSVNHIPITKQDVKILLSIPMGSSWMKSHPNFLESVPEAKDLFAGIPPNTIKQQNHISQAWTATNWSGICYLQVCASEARMHYVTLTIQQFGITMHHLFSLHSTCPA